VLSPLSGAPGSHARERPEPRGDAAHGALRQRAEPVADPDVRAAGRGRHQPVAEAGGGGEAGGVGDAGQPVVGAGLHDGAAELAGAELAAEPAGLLHQRDADGGQRLADGVRGGEAADAAAHDDDVAVGPGGVHES
jgi:hypothetical protein